VNWFGKRWDAPLVETGKEVPVPIGTPCLHCHEAISEDDQGVMVPLVMGAFAELRPAHRECFARSILGSLSHLEKRCTCYGGQDPDEDGLSWRDSARRVMAYLDKRRR